MTTAYSAIVFIVLVIVAVVAVLLLPAFELLQVMFGGMFGWIFRLGRSPARGAGPEGVWTEEMERREELNTNEQRPLYQTRDPETRGAGGMIGLVFIVVLLVALILRVSGIWS
ncbi:MAG: hypothetical protein J2P28_24325 [Actinobacteria bacterium]|nr:hypothetical protein [Actinomycetota bacterium]